MSTCNIAVIGVYCSPNKSFIEFQQTLSEIEALAVQAHPHRVLIAGDFNAKSVTWGSPSTSTRGEFLEGWSTTMGLELLNVGSINTCVRQQGGSIVDLTFASPALARYIQNWAVKTDVETLSDHRYIRFDVSTFIARSTAGSNPQASEGPRWSIKMFDRELAVEASVVESWVANQPDFGSIDAAVDWLNATLTRICDASMPRQRRPTLRNRMYWWKPELRRLRRLCVAARRQYTRSRRRRTRDLNRERELYSEYRATCTSLHVAIKNAKEEAWEQWLESLNRDPWGRPYKTVSGKLRPWTPPLTTSLEPQLLERVVSTLFPQCEEWTPPVMSIAPDVSQEEEIPQLTDAELGAALLRLQSKNSAPGLDGIPGRVIVPALKEIGNIVKDLFTACLLQGRFPQHWKTGKLVLLRKAGRPVDSPSAYRPIVLLNEISKLFERVLVSRLNGHLERVGPGLHDRQFGFRRGRSTLDAIASVKSLTDEAVAQGEVVLAVSLDIANAFNTLPWNTIMEALRYHRVPQYLRQVIADYFRDRAVTYPTQTGWLRREMSCGVPQGSVLGPLLWNIGYDYVLRGVTVPGVQVFCYADDTLLTSRGPTYEEAVGTATTGVTEVVEKIQSLGLKVALEKSEALFFHRRRKIPPHDLQMTVCGSAITIKSYIKYLGLVLDGRWNFKEHFRQLAPKLVKFCGMLGRLLPNLGGPSSACRRLFTGVVRSKAMYGAPIWADALGVYNRTILRRPQRVMAQRAIRAYSTVSFEAACILASSPPWDLEAEALALVYRKTAQVKSTGNLPHPEEITRWRESGREILLRKWSDRLESPTASHEMVAAFRPILRSWVDRKFGALSYHLTQMITGHGCFGRYLCRVARREPTTACHHCSCDEDTAEHTRAVCQAWKDARELVNSTTRGDMSLPGLARVLAESEDGWNSIASFAEVVMTAKETAERVRENDPLAHPMRRKRPGRRRLGYGSRL